MTLSVVRREWLKDNPIGRGLLLVLFFFLLLLLACASWLVSGAGVGEKKSAGVQLCVWSVQFLGSCLVWACVQWPSFQNIQGQTLHGLGLLWPRSIQRTSLIGWGAASTPSRLQLGVRGSYSQFALWWYPHSVLE